MLSQSVRAAFKYLAGSRASPLSSTATLVTNYLEQDTGSKRAANLPVSQRFFYERGNQSGSSASGSGVSQRHQAVQLRLGDAQMLASTHQSHLSNTNDAHPLFFAHTNPREAGLCATLLSSLYRLRIHRLTELQGALVPLVLKGKHVIAHSETGTGKSFGIALAIANRIARDAVNYRLHTIVLVPSEELALQYDKWFRHFGGCSAQVVQVAIDSVPLDAQLARLHNIQPHVLVGTPQRMAEIVRLSPTILGEKLRRKVDCVVLDEADVILRMPIQYGHQRIDGANLVERVFRHGRDEVPAQLVAASATVDGTTAQTLNAWTRNDKAVRLTTSFVEHTIPPTIRFYFYAESRQYPLPKALELVMRLICHQTAQPRVLLFTSDDQVQAVSQLINERIAPHLRVHNPLSGVSRISAPLHEVPEATGAAHGQTPRGRHAQGARRHREAGNAHRGFGDTRATHIVTQPGNIYVKDSSALSALHEGTLLAGVGSFSMGRGLHVKDITHVILYGDCPPTNTFVHCAGRTGRLGEEGDVVVLFPPSSGRTVQQVCHAVEVPFVPGKLHDIAALLPPLPVAGAQPRDAATATPVTPTSAGDSFGSVRSLQAVDEENEALEENERMRKLAYLESAV